MTKNVSARKEQEVKKGRDKKQKHTYSQVHEALLRMFKNEKSINKVFIQQHDLKFNTSKGDYSPHFP